MSGSGQEQNKETIVKQDLSHISSGLRHLAIPIDDIAPDANNAMGHDEANIAEIARSLDRFGQRKPLVGNRRTGQTEAGAGTWLAAKKLGWQYIAVSWEDDDPAIAAQFGVADNATPSADWDMARLQEIWEGSGGDVPGLDEGRLKELWQASGQATNGKVKDIEPQIDKAAELQEKWGTQLGQVWQLGDHRIGCLDSTDAKSVKTLFDGKTAVAALFATDPPYGIAYGEKGTQNWKGEQDRLKIASDAFKDDALQEFLEAVFNLWANTVLKPNAAWYLWHAHLTQGFFAAAAAAAANVILHRQIIWVKPSLVLGMGQYHWKHEPCFFGWVKGNQPPDYGDRRDVTVWEVGRQNDTPHPTEKPTALFIKPILKHTKRGEVCAEPFLGSGSQLMACEELDRTCIGSDIEPKNIAVVIQRWVDLTGGTPDLVETLTNV